MTIRYDRPVSRAASMARRVALVSLIMFVIAVVAHRFGPMQTPSLLAMMVLSALLAGLTILLAAGGLYSLWMVGAKGGKAASLAIFMAAVPLLPPAFAVGPLFTRPAIHDISTDVDNPPEFLKAPDADQGWLPGRNPVTASDRQAQQQAYPGLIGRRYDGALDRVLAAVRTVADARGIRITIEEGAPQPLFEVPAQEKAGPDKTGQDKANADQPVADGPDAVPVPLPRPEPEAAVDQAGLPGDVFLQGETRSLLFGFRSDVVIRLREEEETTLVDIRIASRYGVHDLGSGDGFAEAYLKALDAELLGIAGD